MCIDCLWLTLICNYIRKQAVGYRLSSQSAVAFSDGKSIGKLCIGYAKFFPVDFTEEYKKLAIGCLNDNVGRRNAATDELRSTS